MAKRKAWVSIAHNSLELNVDKMKWYLNTKWEAQIINKSSTDGEFPLLSVLEKGFKVQSFD